MWLTDIQGVLANACHKLHREGGRHTDRQTETEREKAQT